jgi:DNA polymerase-3 subunit delta'
MIIWQPELMHPNAANGILKILEEPAAYTYFILVTNAADKLLPTIISRAQIVNIPLLTDNEVVNHLKSMGSVDEARARKAAHLADGNLAVASRLLENEEDDNTQRFIEWMRCCFKRNFGSLVTMAEEYHGLDKLRQRNLMLYSMNMMRETLLNISNANELHRIQGEEQKFVQDFSKVMNVKKIESSYTLINDAAYHLERNGSAKMIFLDLSLKLAQVINPN